MNDIQSICVYSGSADGLAQDFLSAAYDLGCMLADRGIRAVYGGGKTGLMGAFAEGVLAHSGHITGVVPTVLNRPNLIHSGLTELVITRSIHERKAKMSELADAFISLPGGFGTMEELFETLTWSQIGLHHKPVGILNISGYFDPILAMIKHMTEEGFILNEHPALFVHSSCGADLLTQLKNFQKPVSSDRWVNRPKA